MNTKNCTICLIDKPLNAFRSHLLGKYGLHSQCRECQRISTRAYMQRARQERPNELKEIKRKSMKRTFDKIKSRNKAFYLKNRQDRLKKAAIYRQENRDKINVWHRKNYAENKESKTLQTKTYYQTHKMEIRDRQLIYKNMHKAEIRMHNRLRKLKLSFSNSDYTQKDWLDCLVYWHHSCAICGCYAQDSRIICSDHWIPLSKGGLTHKTNILPLCHGINGCNNFKQAKNPIDWLVEYLGENAANIKLSEIQAYFNSL